MENTIVEIDDMLEETGLSVSTCRVRALPYHSDVEKFIEEHEENNKYRCFLDDLDRIIDIISS